MSTSQHAPSPRRRLSLTARFSALLVLAVVLPLLITVVGSELILRPTLLSQAATEMGNDAQVHAQAIDSLFIARLQNLGYLRQFFAIQKYLSGDETYQTQAQNELALGYHLDTNYSNWSLFDAQGKLRLSYPAPPGMRGKYTIPPEIMDQLHNSNKAMTSDVYYDDNTHMAFVDVYASVTSTDNTLLGFERSTVKLSEIWTAVNNETNAVPGSYAMILDNHGVRIAYTNTDTTLTTLPQGLFKSVAPLSKDFQQRVADEDLYGNGHRQVTVAQDDTLSTMLQQNTQTSTVFQLTPAFQNEAFQAYRVKCQTVPWTYLVLRPVNTITKAANQQDFYLLLIAAVITLLAALVGLIVGRSITRPILQSVSSLFASSQMLKTQASREQVKATEQKWIVESSQVGLKSVQYYTEAASVAAHRMNEMSGELAQKWGGLDIQRAQQRLAEIVSTANYIEKAISHQEKSSKSLSTAIRITTQVTEQLVEGATSANEAASQLETVIEQLRQVVGK
jgi:methyl-accepting chemotaxis protein